MRPIVLTYKSGRAVYVNPWQVTHFGQSSDLYETLVFLVSESIPLNVIESPEAIAAAFADSTAQQVLRA